MFAVISKAVGNVNVFHPAVPDAMFQVYGPAKATPSVTRQMRTVWLPPSTALVYKRTPVIWPPASAQNLVPNDKDCNRSEACLHSGYNRVELSRFEDYGN